MRMWRPTTTNPGTRRSALEILHWWQRTGKTKLGLSHSIEVNPTFYLQLTQELDRNGIDKKMMCAHFFSSCFIGHLAEWVLDHISCRPSSIRNEKTDKNSRKSQ